VEGFDGPLLAHPEQAGDADVDLIDQGQVLVVFGVLDFIDADGVNLPRGVRRSSPQVTTCSTASKTFSREVRKAWAVSFHDSRRAQRAS